MKRKVYGGFVLLLVIAVYGIVGEMDYQDAVNEQSQYCSMVKDGNWPDFRKTYKAECGGKNPPKFVANRD